MSDADATPILDVAFDRSGPNLTVYLTGEVDMATGPSLSDQVIDELRRPAGRVELDLSAVDYCDSAGLRAFVALHHYVTGTGGTFVLGQPRPQMRRLLDATGIREVVTVMGVSP